MLIFNKRFGVVAMCDFVLSGGLYRDVDLVVAGAPQVTFPRGRPESGSPSDPAGSLAAEGGGPG